MSAAFVRRFGLSVAAAALFAAGASALEVKGPVHITSRGVETITAEEFDAGFSSPDGFAGLASAREAAAEGRRVAAEAAREAQEAAREAAAEARAHAGDVAREAREAARAAAADARDAAAEAHAQAAEVAREARRHARIALRLSLGALPVLKTGLRVEIDRAAGDLSEARLDLVASAMQLAAVQAGDFSDVMIVSMGRLKCGDVAAHPGCAPLTEADKARLAVTLDAALQAAGRAMEAAQSGLGAAARAAADGAAP